jgi:prepilin-type N-terminal cleavage/methylation domain-containing protein
MRQSNAFTLVELLVVIAIIGILVALTLCGVQAARDTSRRVKCQYNLSSLALAIHNYELTHRVLPAGVLNKAGPIENAPVGYHHNWLSRILPHMDQPNVFRAIDWQESVYAIKNLPVRRLSLPLLQCPSDPATADLACTNYAAIHHGQEAPIDESNHGPFVLNRFLSLREITDGLAHTMFLAEKIGDDKDLGWMSGTRATLRNLGSIVQIPAPPATPPLYLSQTDWDQLPPQEQSADLAVWKADPNPQRVGGIGSWHQQSVNAAFGDGATRGIQVNVDPKLLRQWGNRADGELPLSN